MVLKVYISGMSGNKEVKKRQQRVLMILESKNIQYEAIDITEPGRETDKEFMQNKSTSNGATVSDPEPRHALPPQIFNEEEYCGDYDAFDLANEIDTLELFLKVAPPMVETPAAVPSAENGEGATIDKDGGENKENEGGETLAAEETKVKDGEAANAVENAENTDKTVNKENDEENQDIDDNKTEDKSKNTEGIGKGDGAAYDKTKSAADKAQDDKDEVENTDNTVNKENDEETKDRDDNKNEDESKNVEGVEKGDGEAFDTIKSAADTALDDEAENSEVKEDTLADHSKEAKEIGTKLNESEEIKNDSKEEDSDKYGAVKNDAEETKIDSKAKEDLKNCGDGNGEEGKDEETLKDNNNKTKEGRKKTGEEAEEDTKYEDDEKENEEDKYDETPVDGNKITECNTETNDSADEFTKKKEKYTKDTHNEGLRESKENSGGEDKIGTIGDDESVKDTETENKQSKNKVYDDSKNETQKDLNEENEEIKKENPEKEPRVEKEDESIKNKEIVTKDGEEKKETTDGEKNSERIGDIENITNRESCAKEVDDEYKTEINHNSEIDKPMDQTNTNGQSKKEAVEEVATSEAVKTVDETNNVSSRDEE